MVDVDKAVIAKLKTHGAIFEILVNCDNAIKLKEGIEVDMKDTLATEKIFSDAAKGLLASETQMKTIFGTEDSVEIAKKIISKGDIQLTTEYRTKLRDDKKKQIISAIQRNGIDPRTNLPHPKTRIELAFEQIKVHIEEFKGVEEQVQEIVKKIQPILPIKFEKKQVMITIGSQYAGKCYPIVKNYGKLHKDEWQNDGSWVSIVEIPAGMIDEFYDQINNVTHGEVETKILDSSKIK